MNDESVLSDLLSIWQHNAEKGCDKPAAELCPDRPELISELERRIEALRRVNDLLLSDDTSKTLPPSKVQPTASFAVPLTMRRGDEEQTETRSNQASVPGYDILGELGRGGMGIVYKAVHLKLKRVVALKMILSGAHAKGDQLDRFRTEAEAVARLQHPNIVQIYEIGENQGNPFFSLEFVENGSLDRLIAGTPQPPRSSAVLMVTLCRAMHAAHQRAIIHRDLKPANVLLARKEDIPSTPASADTPLDSFEPKITDFGLAKRLDDPGMTRTGSVMGTPSYMAPEQARGEIDAIGPPTDVYALSAILYELLTGRPPFKGATVLDTLDQVCTQDPVPPRRLQPKTPRDLETICLKGLQKDSRQRYPSASEMADDLTRYLNHQTIHARPARAWEVALKWARRRPLQAALALALILAVFGTAASAVFYGLYQEGKTTALRQALERRNKIDQFRDGGDEAEKNGHLEDAVEQWTQALAVLDAGSDSSADALRNQIEERLQRGRQALEDVARRRQFQDKIHNLRKYRDDVRFHEITIMESDAVSNRKHIIEEASVALTPLGLISSDGKTDSSHALVTRRRHFDSAEQMGQVAADCYQILFAWAEAEATQASDRAGAERALRLLNTAAALAEVHQLPTPQAYHRRRADYLEAVGKKDEAQSERGLVDKQAETVLDHFLSALALFRANEPLRAAAKCEEVLSREPDNYFMAQYLQTLCYVKAKHWGEAEIGATSCLGRRPDFGFWPRLLRASACFGQGDLSAAATDFNAALNLADDDSQRAAVRISRSSLYIQQQHLDDVLTSWAFPGVQGLPSSIRQPRLDAALTDTKEAIRLQPKWYQAHSNLARIYEEQKDWDAALKALSQALDCPIRDRKEVALLYHIRARLYLIRGNPMAAQDDLKHAIANKPDSLKLASVHVELAQLQHKAGDDDEALKSCDEALTAIPDYPLAHRERAEILLSQKHFADAGRSLDRYLAKGPPEAVVYEARGLIHAQLGEYLKAVDAYDKALTLKPDATTRRLRGWIYLRLESPRLALADFEASLQLDPNSASALCGRGRARALLGDVGPSVADAEAALKKGPRTDLLLFNAACIYAAAMGPDPQTGRRSSGDENRTRLQERAVELLRDALEAVRPEANRPAFWRNNVRTEPVLKRLRFSPWMQQLSLKYDVPSGN